MVVSMTYAKSYKFIQYTSLPKAKSILIFVVESLWNDVCSSHWAEPCGLTLCLNLWMWTICVFGPIHHNEMYLLNGLLGSSSGVIYMEEW